MYTIASNLVKVLILTLHTNVQVRPLTGGSHIHHNNIIVINHYDFCFEWLPGYYISK